MKISKCPACGAPLPPETMQCPYCQNYLQPDASREQKPEMHLHGASETTEAHGFAFERRPEPNEQAFTIAVPHGWILEGGIMRADFTRQMINAQFIEAKLDLSAKRDAQGTVMLRWGPEIKYCDTRMMPAAFMFPQGSNYAGMIVWPVMSAADFIIHNVFPWAHPQAQNARVIEQRAEPALIDRYRRNMANLGIPTNAQYDAAEVAFSYQENNLLFTEKIHVIIENMGPMAGSMWSNKDTVLMRAPTEAFTTWEAVLKHIESSGQLNPRWLAHEIASQEMLSRQFRNAQQAQQARDQRMLEILNHMQQVDREITEHRARTNAEIMNDTYLTLMEQEEYVNPYTNEPETGSNQWQYRWVSEDGAEFYTDREEDDPNIPGVMNKADWKRTPVRKRFPQ
ncbi:MAG: zinc ribbon domain-containing protein [Anaerolineae bacterium]|nr:zinc ribbon domain-containing protein [Anaerolineae bacterium]